MTDVKRESFVVRGPERERMARPPGTPTPCWQCAKCAGVTDKSPWEGERRTLTTRNVQFIRAFFERRRPTDAAAARMYGVIRWVLAEHDRTQRGVMIDLMAMRAGR